MAKHVKADVREVKRGNWILPRNRIAQQMDEWICSNCNYLILHKRTVCPHCGAIMDEVVSDDKIC